MRGESGHVCLEEGQNRGDSPSLETNHSAQGFKRPSRPYCQPGTPRMSGRWWAMPLWQSMQVFSLVNRKRWCATEARGDCLVMSMESALWQLRHSRESLALKRAHSCAASSSRWSRNFSRVSMVPKILPQTSFEACILRAILSVQLCGTWQSGQVARTPERFEKWIVVFSSSNTFSRISWQEVQNFSVLVSSSAVLNAPQNMMPAMNPPSTSTPSANTELGRRSVSHRSHPNA